MRHQTGQLGGLGAVDLAEVQRLREENAKRLKEIEDVFYKEQD